MHGGPTSRFIALIQTMITSRFAVAPTPRRLRSRVCGSSEYVDSVSDSNLRGKGSTVPE